MTLPKILTKDEYADYVFCNNCESVILVNIGTEICPICGEEGCMSWVDNNEPEVKTADW